MHRLGVAWVGEPGAGWLPPLQLLTNAQLVSQPSRLPLPCLAWSGLGNQLTLALPYPNATTRAQVAIAKRMIATDGVGSLYKGLSAGLLRQVSQPELLWLLGYAWLVVWGQNGRARGWRAGMGCSGGG